MLENAGSGCLKPRFPVFSDGTFEAIPRWQGPVPRAAGRDHRPDAPAGPAGGSRAVVGFRPSSRAVLQAARPAGEGDAADGRAALPETRL